MTKYNDHADLDKHCEMARVERGKGRHRLTPNAGEGEYEVINDDSS